ncbi:MAG: M28 family peptidase, partial [Bacteroidales bacterium]|nr:M28 family peptidase [Bacteroidales bacterium]
MSASVSYAQGNSSSRNFIPSARNAENVISEKTLSSTIEFLTDSLCQGRRTSSRGAIEAAFYIERRFKKAGLLPVNGSYSQSFPIKNEGFSGIGHNVLGVLPGAHAKDGAGYIIVAAHYDNLGTIDGKMFPGADSNASGVSSMLSILDMLTYMNKLGKIYNKNVLFVGFDAKELSMAGSQALWDAIAKKTLIDPNTNKPITKE